MTAEEMALALRRITARFSPPQTVFSDNAPQYKPLKEVLERMYTHDWDWKNIVSGASWMGGAYERLVGITKQAILRTFHGVALNESQFRTALVEIASILNSRPNTYTSNDLEDMPLTPSHFLQAHLSNDEVDPQLEAPSTATTRLQRLFQQHSHLLDRFWSYWRHSYLQFLRERTNENQFPKRTVTFMPKVGDVVLIEADNTKRNHWKMGRITDLPVSADGQIRSAILRVATGHNIARPLTMLYPIETEPPVEIQPPPKEDDNVSIISVDLDVDF